jgi:hypothetical protein
MPESAQHPHHRYEVLHVPSAQPRPEGDRTFLDEARPEKIHPVPHDRDRESSSISPWAVLASKNDDGNVDQCLETVKNSELWKKNRRYEQRHKENCCSYVDQYLLSKRSPSAYIAHISYYGMVSRPLILCTSLKRRLEPHTLFRRLWLLSFDLKRKRAAIHGSTRQLV